MPRPAALLLVLLAAAAAAQEEEGVSRLDPAEGRAGGWVYSPPGEAREGPPLVVALHEEGETAEDLFREVRPLAAQGELALLCPGSRGLGFDEADLSPVLAAAREVRESLGPGPVHLLGRGDAGYRALLYAFAEPREFRCVVALGTDVPAERAPRRPSALRLLVMKGVEDRPAAGRESVLAVRERVEVAEFRTLPGDGREMDPATRAYLLHFLGAASGRAVAGDDRNLPWRDGARGLAERRQRKVPALVYLWDDAPAHESRTRKIQNEALFDAEVRAAAEAVVPVLAPRAEAGTLLPDVRLKPGPALVVLDAEGGEVGVLQQKVTAGALVLLLQEAARR